MYTTVTPNLFWLTVGSWIEQINSEHLCSRGSLFSLCGFVFIVFQIHNSLLWMGGLLLSTETGTNEVLVNQNVQNLRSFSGTRKSAVRFDLGYKICLSCYQNTNRKINWVFWSGEVNTGRYFKFLHDVFNFEDRWLLQSIIIIMIVWKKQPRNRTLSKAILTTFYLLFSGKKHPDIYFFVRVALGVLVPLPTRKGFPITNLKHLWQFPLWKKSVQNHHRKVQL